MHTVPTSRRPTDPSYRGPRTVGGIPVYLLAPPLVVAALAVLGSIAAAATGAVTALVVQKLRNRRRWRSGPAEPRSAPSRA